MKKILLGIVLGISSLTAISVAYAESQFRNFEEQQAAERKAKQDARIECIRSGKDASTCPSAY